jgi:predicted AAA+ superfamily ATPase
MVGRIQELSKINSFFLFGARGTGKTTLLKHLYSGTGALWIDLLKEADEERYGRRPDELSLILASQSFQRVIIDEIQKAPKLLDIVHLEMERDKKTQFILTGSSARKLKRGAANLLAGRAFTYHLFPFTGLELGDRFQLQEALEFGSLPKVYEYAKGDDKNEFLRAYVKTYLKEEIQVEQLVRRLNPFRDFLEIAAQSNGQMISYSKIGRDVGVDDKTVHTYFSILEDTLVGFFLPAYGRSVRKQQREAPKFYFFDTGVVRALSGTLRVELVPKTYAFGKAFEHWVIAECHRMNEYKKCDFRFSYLRTKDDVEIDLIIKRPGQRELLVEIKSTQQVLANEASRIKHLSQDWDIPCEAQIWSLDQEEKNIDGILCLPWQEGLRRAF